MAVMSQPSGSSGLQQHTVTSVRTHAAPVGRPCVSSSTRRQAADATWPQGVPARLSAITYQLNSHQLVARPVSCCDSVKLTDCITAVQMLTRGTHSRRRQCGWSHHSRARHLPSAKGAVSALHSCARPSHIWDSIACILTGLQACLAAGVRASRRNASLPLSQRAMPLKADSAGRVSRAARAEGRAKHRDLPHSGGVLAMRNCLMTCMLGDTSVPG